MMLEYRRTPAAEIDNRIARFQAALRRDALDGALILQIIDLYYFTGAAQQAALFVPVVGEPRLFVRKSVTRATEDSPLPVSPFRSFRELPKRLADAGFLAGGKLGLTLDTLPAALYLQLAGLFDGANLVDVSSAVRQVRSIKSAWEVERLREAATVSAAMFAAAGAALRPGVREIELVAEIEAAARRLGAQGISRMRAFNQIGHFGALVSGPNGAVVGCADSSVGGQGLSPAAPLSAGWRAIQPNEPVLLDYAIAVNGYHVDRTQTFVIGSLRPDLQAAYDATVTIQTEILRLVRPGVAASALYDRGVAVARELGYADGFLGHGEGQVRFVGHGIGVEVDEWPVLAPGQSTPLELGMVLAIEPKIVLPGCGIVGLEHNWLVTDAGADRLTLGDDVVIATSP